MIRISQKLAIPIGALALCACGPRTYSFAWQVTPQESAVRRVREGLTSSEIRIRARCALDGNNAAWADTVEGLARVCSRDFQSGELTAEQYDAVATFSELLIGGFDDMQCAGDQMPIPPPGPIPEASHALLAAAIPSVTLASLERSLQAGRCAVTLPPPSQ